MFKWINMCRQIKNAIRTAQAVVARRRCSLSYSVLKEVLESADFGEMEGMCTCQQAKLNSYYGQGERANYLKTLYGTGLLEEED